MTLLRDAPGSAPVTIDMLDAVISRQFVPVGGKIEYWRPVATEPIPAGYEVADGRTIVAANHDYVTRTDIVLPDMRNRFSLGADLANADGNAGSTSAGPGIGGAGGSHTANLAHSHTVASHAHGITADGDHSHTVNLHSHTVNSHVHVTILPIGKLPGSGDTTPTGLCIFDPSDTRLDDSGCDSHWHATESGNRHQIGINPTLQPNNTNWLSDLGGGQQQDVYLQLTNSQSPGTDSQAPGTHVAGQHSHFGATGAAAPGTDSQLSSATDIRPKYVGWLVLIKVKRS